VRRTVIVLMASILGLMTAATLQADGGELFQRRCSTCHGKEGKGDTAIGKKKNLKALGSPEVQALSDSELTSRIAEGVEPVGKDDRQHAFKDKGLSDDDIAELVTFIRALARRR